MSTSENKELVRQVYKGWNAINGDVAKIRALYERYYAPDYIHHDPSRDDVKLEQRVQFAVEWFTAFPDTTWFMDGMLAEGDMVACRYTMRFTHAAAFMGIAPTGRQIVVKGADVRKIRGGKVVEGWDFLDTMGMMVQVGAIPGQPVAGSNPAEPTKLQTESGTDRKVDRPTVLVEEAYGL
jgi:predicted ester cyclase